MAYEKDDFNDDNELPRFEDEEELGADREDVVEDETEELVVEERPVGGGAPLPPPLPDALLKKAKAKKGGKSKKAKKAKKARKAKKSRKAGSRRKSKGGKRGKRAKKRGRKR
jgi:hypothetical protein